MQASMGLSYLSSITSHFINVLQWMVFDLFLLRDSENDVKFAMRFQPVVKCYQCIRKHSQRI